MLDNSRLILMKLSAAAKAEVKAEVDSSLDTAFPSSPTPNSMNAVLKPLHSGTAQAGAAGSITLASGASASDDFYNSVHVMIIAGTGAGQSRLISDYVGSTRVATVAGTWVTNPDNTSVYTLLPQTGLTAAQVNAEVIGGLDTAIGTPVANSPLDVLKDLDGLLPASTIAAAESYKINIVQGVARTLSSTGTTNVIDTSETGILIALALMTDGDVTGAPTSKLEFVVDGGSVVNLNCHNVSDNWHSHGLLPYKVELGASGAASGDNAVIPFGGLRYETSIRIGINCSSSGSTGATRMHLIRGTKI